MSVAAAFANTTQPPSHMEMTTNRGKELSFKPIVSDENVYARFGGGCALPQEMPWPAAPDGRPLVLCTSLTAEFLNEYLEFEYPAGHSVSVFTTYAPDTYFLDLITYHGDPAEKKVLDAGYVKVLLHETAASLRAESTYVLPASEITLGDELDDKVTYQRSKIGGHAHLIQNENLDTNSMNFCLQLTGSDLPEGARDVFFGESNVGYLYLRRAVTDIAKFNGMFFVQCS